MNNRGRWFHFARLKALKKHTTPARVFRASLPWHAMGVCLEKRKPNMKPDGSIYQFCYFQFLSEQILFREKNVFLFCAYRRVGLQIWLTFFWTHSHRTPRQSRAEKRAGEVCFLSAFKRVF